MYELEVMGIDQELKLYVATIHVVEGDSKGVKAGGYAESAYEEYQGLGTSHQRQGLECRFTLPALTTKIPGVIWILNLISL